MMCTCSDDKGAFDDVRLRRGKYFLYKERSRGEPLLLFAIGLC